MIWQDTPYALPLAAAAVIAAALGSYVLLGHRLRRPSAPGAASFATLLFAAAAWSTCSALEMASVRRPTTPAAYWSSRTRQS